MVLRGNGGVSIGPLRKKVFLPVLLLLLALAAGLWWEGEQEYRGFSQRTALRIVAEAGLEQSLSVCMIGDRSAWQRLPPCSEPGLVKEAVALLEEGEGRRMRWYGAPTPEEIWIFSLADGREVLVGWWNVAEWGSPTITGDLYGDLPTDGDRLIRVSRETFWRIQRQLLEIGLLARER